MTTERTATINHDDHTASWLENVGDDGMLDIRCEVNTGGILIEAGWAHIDYCPVCGFEIDLTVEEA